MYVINVDLKNLSQWLKSNKLSHVTKTELRISQSHGLAIVWYVFCEIFRM